MNDETRRQIVYSLLNLFLSLAAAWLATYITNKLLGEPEAKELLS